MHGGTAAQQQRLQIFPLYFSTAPGIELYYRWHIRHLSAASCMCGVRQIPRHASARENWIVFQSRPRPFTRLNEEVAYYAASVTGCAGAFLRWALSTMQVYWRKMISRLSYIAFVRAAECGTAQTFLLSSQNDSLAGKCILEKACITVVNVRDAIYCYCTCNETYFNSVGGKWVVGNVSQTDIVEFSSSLDIK
jgi:hypothetical protein